MSQKIQGAVSPEEHTLLIDDCPSAKQKSKATPEFWDVPTAREMPDCQCGSCPSNLTYSVHACWDSILASSKQYLHHDLWSSFHIFKSHTST